MTENWAKFSCRVLWFQATTLVWRSGQLPNPYTFHGDVGNEREATFLLLLVIPYSQLAVSSLTKSCPLLKTHQAPSDFFFLNQVLADNLGHTSLSPIVSLGCNLLHI